MNYEEVRLQQQEILKEVFNSRSYPQTEEQCAGMLQEVLRHSEAECEAAFGDFGGKLWRFAGHIDLSHPDLNKLCSGHLTSDSPGTFSRDARDALKILCYGVSHNISAPVLESVRRAVLKHDQFKIISPIIDSPVENLLNVRFIPKRFTRDTIRSGKRMQNVGSALTRKTAEFWDQQPTNFMSYRRNHNRFGADVTAAQERMGVFQSMGLSAMAMEIEKTVQEVMAKWDSETYYGFNKISLVTAAVILSKVVGYGIAMDCKYRGVSADIIGCAPVEMFKEYGIVDEDYIGSSLLYKKLEYVPRAYTYQEWRSKAPTSMVEIVDFLEDYPECGGKALFDHYRILVPSVNYPGIYQKDPYHFTRKDGTVARFTSLVDCQKAFDMELVDNQDIVGILLGERDGDHYFISYWM